MADLRGVGKEITYREDNPISDLGRGVPSETELTKT